MIQGGKPPCAAADRLVKAATSRRTPNAHRALILSVQSQNYAALGETRALDGKPLFLKAKLNWICAARAPG